MNKISGSIVAKLFAWLVCIISTIMTVAFAYLTIEGISTGYFNMSYDEAVFEAFKNVNALYSVEAWQNMNKNKSQSQLTAVGFKYGILQKDSLADVDLKNKKNYVITNFTDEELKIADKNKLYLYELCSFGDGSQEGKAYGLVGDWEDLSEAGIATKENTWISQYADAVCYDAQKGIFYYRSYEYYYPVHNVLLNYETNNGEEKYSYSYSFEKKRYMLNHYVVDDYDENAATQEDDKIHAILRGDSSGYVDFSKLNDTEFNYMSWGEILLDSVRNIDGSELTIIDTNSIDNKYFISSGEYYLDDNYTLHVSQNTVTTCYWIVSIVPEASSLIVSSSLYGNAVKFADLFYSFGENASVIMIICIIIMLLSLCFLIYAAGRRKNREETVLTWIDRIPLEIFSVIAFFVACVPVSIMAIAVTIEEVRDSSEVFLTFLISGIAGTTVVLVLYILSICVRLKNKVLWENTICHKLYDVIKKNIIMFYENMALIWRITLVLIIKALVELYAMVLCRAGRALIVLWFFEQLITAAIVLRITLQLYELQKAAEKMAQGNLGYNVDTEKMLYGLKKHGENLNKIGMGISKAVDERMKSEHFKTELITNVSHDIKTPLTSIINYVDLLEKEELNNEKAQEYLAVLERQASRLKKLTEDLVEASKAASGSLPVNNELLEVGVFLTQTVGEFEERMLLTGLELIVKKPDEPVYIYADGRHLWRVTDNLMSNICKYSQPSSRVYVNLEVINDRAVIIFRNISGYPINVDGNDLTERFVRGDKSRNTEGHGLGLSIAKSLMDLMNADMNILTDGDLFKVILSFELHGSSVKKS